MNVSRTLLCLAVSLWLSAGTMNAQSPARSDTTTARRVTPPPQVPAAANSDSLITVLRAQNELMERYHDRLLATVYWSLGGLGVIAGLLLGFGWYANFKVYERDKNALRQELRGLIREDSAAARDDAQSALSQIQAQLEERLNTIAAEAREAGGSAAEAVQTQVNRLSRDVRKELRELQYRVTEIQADTHRRQGLPANELLSTLQLMRFALQFEWDWRISSGLDRMRRIFREEVELDADLSKEVVEVLDQLPAQYAPEVENVKTALRNARA